MSIKILLQDPKNLSGCLGIIKKIVESLDSFFAENKDDYFHGTEPTHSRRNIYIKNKIVVPSAEMRFISMEITS